MKKFLSITIALITAVIIFKSVSFFANRNTLTNWGGIVTCNGQLFYPKTKQDIIHILQKARQHKKSVRAYGSAHSWSTIFCADYIINTDSFNKILEVDKHKRHVKVEGGIKLYELNEELAKLDLALPNIGATAAQSIVGATATATHGSGKTGTMADFIHELELITADGKTHILSKESNPEQFAAARTSIGSLGVIYSVTLQCEPLYKLKHSRIVSDWATISQEYKQLRENNDYFQFFLNPYSDKVLVYTFNKTIDKPTTLWNYWLSFKDKLFIGRIMGTVWVKLLEIFPRLTPSFTDMFFKGAERKDQVDYGYRILINAKKSHQEVVYQEEEIAIPVEHLQAAVQDIKALVHKYTKDNFYVFMWGILFRFVKADTHNYLSPAAGRDTVYISITSSWVHPEFYKEYQEKMLEYSGRPHWGKINFVNNSIAQKLYGQNLDKFIEVRNHLDPQKLFSNAFTTAVLEKNN